MEEFNPKVSIIIPVFNGANYLKEAIDSALKQTYKNIEIIVVNDGSTDQGKTEEIALSYGDKVRYFKKDNGGVASALNLGIKLMNGEYFSWLSHDDLYEGTKVEDQIKILNDLKNKKTLICCRYKVVNKELEYIQENSFGKEKDKLNEPAVKYLFKGYVHGCCLLIHKDHFDRVGTFKENLKTTQDFDLWFRMLRGESIYFNNEIGVISRSHDEQDSKKLYDYHMKECDDLWINMAETLTNEEKIAMSGSEFAFYKEIYDFLHVNTPYKGCVQYLKEKFIKTLKEEIIREEMENDFFEIKEDKELERENEELKKQLADMQNSKSWRITAPLRIIVSKIKNK